MSDTAAAIRAAREVQADVLAPELFRRANEIFFKARREYKFKNFSYAKTLAEQARKLAEQAEFDSLRGGATRENSDANETYSELPSNPRAKGGGGNATQGATGGAGGATGGYEYPLPEPTPAGGSEGAAPNAAGGATGGGATGGAAPSGSTPPAGGGSPAGAPPTSNNGAPQGGGLGSSDALGTGPGYGGGAPDAPLGQPVVRPGSPYPTDSTSGTGTGTAK